jgi:hypothetical protein
MTLVSSLLVIPKASPPRTKTRVPDDAMAWPDLPLGAGPIFWNMYHRWSIKRECTHKITPMQTHWIS